MLIQSRSRGGGRAPARKREPSRCSSHCEMHLEGLRFLTVAHRPSPVPCPRLSRQPEPDCANGQNDSEHGQRNSESVTIPAAHRNLSSLASSPAPRAHARDPLGRKCDERCVRDSGSSVIQVTSAGYRAKNGWLALTSRQPPAACHLRACEPAPCTPRLAESARAMAPAARTNSSTAGRRVATSCE